MKTIDYSTSLKESAADNKWKTAKNVDVKDFPKITRRLRYQAEVLGLKIKIETDKQKHTVSFITSNLKDL